METTDEGVIHKLKEDLKAYAEARFRLIKFIVVDKIAEGVSGIFYSLLILMVVLFFLVFSGVAAGIYIGDLVHSRALGFLIVAGFFLVLVSLIVLLKKSMIRSPLENRMIKEILDPKKYENASHN